MTKKQRREAAGARRQQQGRHRRRPPPPLQARDERSVSCTTFNILAPIYKRMDSENCRESQNRANWFSRNEKIIDRLLADRSSIICLQEVWLGNDELVNMYEKRLGDANYTLFKLARTNNRGDGLLTAVHRNYFHVLNHRELLFNDFGDRVAQLLHVESAMPFWQNRSSSCVQQQSLIVNTHLVFPHDHSLSIVRLKQVYKILQYIEAYQEEHKLGRMPIILCGDWNGSKRGQVYKFLRSQGFVSSYDTAHQYSDSEEDAHKWVSHRNHRGNICGVDFIWLLNPDKCRKPLKTSWNEAVFGIIKYLLLQVASLSEENAFALLKADSPDDHITYSSFSQALCQLGMVHPDRLSSEDIEDLWSEADRDGDGVVDYKEFQVEEALEETDWTMAMQEELNNFIRNEVWSLVERPEQNVIRTKWVFHNKQDEDGIVTRNKASEEFGKMMAKKFKMSMIGELQFFLGFQIKQLKEGTFICQTKYIKDMLKRFDMVNVKPIRTPMQTNGHLDLNIKDPPTSLHIRRLCDVMVH